MCGVRSMMLQLLLQIGMESECSTIDEFEIIKTLGSGLHAKVKLGKLNGNLYAIKKFKKDTADLTNLEHELGILKSLEHPNIIRLHDVRPQATYKKKSGKEEKVLAIILEFAEGGELFEYIAMCGKFSEQIARTYFHMMINALEYLHSKGICHRDIKPENILLDKDFRLRVADFGFSTFLARGRLHTKLGTEGYMAPEIRAKNYDGKEVDLFAAAIILFVMYSGGPPFEKAVPNDPYYKVLAAKNYNVFWGAHSKRKPAGYFSDNFKDLINKMLAVKPEDRLTIEGIKSHPWFKGDVLLLNDIYEEFKERKRVIEQKKQEEASGTRSGGNLTETALELFKKDYELDEKLIQKVEADAKCFVLKLSPSVFYARLNHLLTAEAEEEQPLIHRILDEDTDEIYTVTTLTESPAIEVKLSHNALGENIESKIVIDVAQNKDSNLVLRFLRDEETCETMLFYKLVNFIKMNFIGDKV